MESGFRVFVPALIDRTVAPRNGRARLTNREFIYRSAFELGRHLIGYEVQKVLALCDAVNGEKRRGFPVSLGVFGYGEGGMIAFYAAALEPRIGAVCVSGYFGDRNDVWQQPVDRNVFGLLEQFGDAEVASLIAPRTLVIEAAGAPEFVVPPGTGGAPGRLTTPPLATVKGEVEKARRLVEGLKPAAQIELVASGPDGAGPFGSEEAVALLATAIAPGTCARDDDDAATSSFPPSKQHQPTEIVKPASFTRSTRHNQLLLIKESADVPPASFA